jgi:hypothetical protein
MPKAEEFLSKQLQRHTSAIMIGKITGVNRGRATKIIHLINNAPEELKEKLRQDSIHINEAYMLLNDKPVKTKGFEHTSHWGSRAKIECPSCHHIAPKGDYIII